jgi:hypothetical protein
MESMINKVIFLMKVMILKRLSVKQLSISTKFLRDLGNNMRFFAMKINSSNLAVSKCAVK